jgi:hypothetical protein
MVLFLVYVTIHELSTLFGDGELYRLFFRWRSSEAKLNRRRRIRLLIELNRLTEANRVEAISESGSPQTLRWLPYFMNSPHHLPVRRCAKRTARPSHQRARPAMHSWYA